MPNSLRYQLVRRLLPAMLAMLIAGAATAYWVALHSATLAYDRSLLNTALAISEQIRVTDGHPWLQLTPQAQAVLFTDKYDRIYHSVRGPKGELLHGVELPMPADAQTDLEERSRQYYDGRWEQHPIRIAALRSEHEGVELTVLVGETLVKRNAIVRDILLGMLLPEMLLILATVTLIGIGVRSGLSPLTQVLRQVAGRSQADLSPIKADVPEEMQALVDEINSLLFRLDKSLTSQRHFVSDAAHQLRTPIAALQAQVEATLRQSDPANRQWLEGTLSAARRLSHLVDQLLALARAEPIPSALLPSVQLADIVRETAEIWLPQAIAKEIDLGFELSAAAVRGNALLLGELLSNLLDNAVRHTPPGGAITVSCGSNTEAAWLTVEDSGPGIAIEEREKVFERFYQPANSHSDGCGLGLSIVQAIAFQHGGKATIEASGLLAGARITIRLPVASCDA